MTIGNEYILLLVIVASLAAVTFFIKNKPQKNYKSEILRNRKFFLISLLLIVSTYCLHLRILRVEIFSALTIAMLVVLAGVALED